MKRVAGFLAAAMVAMTAFAMPAAANTKIVVVDSNKLWNETKAGKDVQRQLNAFRESIDTQLREAGETLKTEAIELKKQKDEEAIKEAAFTEKAKELQQKELQLRGGVQQRQMLVQAAARNAQAQFYDAIRPILFELVESKKADILMEKSQVLFASDATEITSAAMLKIEQKLDKLDVVLIQTEGVEGEEEQGPAAPKDKKKKN